MKNKWPTHIGLVAFVGLGIAARSASGQCPTAGCESFTGCSVCSIGFPVPPDEQCAEDLQGANDEPGQKDLTKWCVDFGSGGFELNVKWNWDNVTIPGGNTNDACVLFDTDIAPDGLANLAVCVTTIDGGTPAMLGAVRIFTCGNTRPDRCTSAVQCLVNECDGGSNDGLSCTAESDCPGGTCVPAGSANTTCEVCQRGDDPFLAGDDFPCDTQAVCQIDLDDFLLGGCSASVADAVLLDACSYPSASINSDPSDCIASPPCTNDLQCDDSNPCTIDECDPGVSICVHTPDTGATCDDGDPCSVGEACNALGFCNGAVPVVCNDGVGCTDDSCDPMTGLCVYTPDDGNCDDGVACTDDTCDAINDCQYTPNNANCDDGVACTDDTRDAINDCVYTPNNGNCDDGVACTDDTCDAINDCVYTPNNGNCDDGVACTNDVCDAINDCVYTPDDTNCNDGVACTDDTCDAVNDCVYTPDDTNCNDGVACTDDTCDAINDCVYTPDDTNCDDGVACTDDTCHPVNDCQFTPNDAFCNDGVSCSTDSCDPGAPGALANGCLVVPDDGDCGDGSVCTDDICDPSNPGSEPDGCVNPTFTCTDLLDCPAGASGCVGGLCLCDTAAEIPTVSQWGLFVMTLLGLIGGTLVFGGRRAMGELG